MLHRKSRPVVRIDGVVRTLIDDMVETLRDTPNGVGLSAPQVGILQRVFVAEYEDKLYTFINPEITWRSSETEISEEGCLSLPGYYGRVERHVKVTIKGKNKKGRDITLPAEGYLARIFQHEMDHLDGIMFTDRMAPDEPLRAITPEEEEEELAEVWA